jgi:hypothetical protein
MTTEPKKKLTPVVWPKSLKKSLAKKPHEMQAKILKCVTQLRIDPHHNSLHVHRVNHRPGILEARIDRANRLTFYWDGDTVVVENHCNHEILDRP